MNEVINADDVIIHNQQELDEHYDLSDSESSESDKSVNYNYDHYLDGSAVGNCIIDELNLELFANYWRLKKKTMRNNKPKKKRKSTEEQDLPQQTILNISSAFSGVWSNPEKVDFNNMLMWREDAIQTTCNHHTVGKHLEQNRDEILKILKSKYQPVITSYFKMLQMFPDKRRTIYCGKDLLYSIIKFLRLGKYDERIATYFCKLYVTNKLLLGLRLTIESNIYQSLEY